MATERYLPIDEEGYFVFDGRRVDDEELGKTLLKNLRVDAHNRLVTSMQGQDAWVEPFDAPILLRHIISTDGQTVTADAAYRTQVTFQLKTLALDEWDRFHGTTAEGVPFVFARAAQVEFFDLLDSFDDETITVKGQTYEVPPYPSVPTGPRKFPEAPAAALSSLLTQLKMPKCRVLVLNAGYGYDAAHFAKQGHVVTAVEADGQAVQEIKKRFGELENLKIMQADPLQIPATWDSRFDVIFEHSSYSTIEPSKRNAFIKSWTKVLSPGGHLLGIFTASEWEMRERLKSKFEFLYWTRWRLSEENLKGRELVIYARKR